MKEIILKFFKNNKKNQSMHAVNVINIVNAKLLYNLLGLYC